MIQITQCSFHVPALFGAMSVRLIHAVVNDSPVFFSKRNMLHICIQLCHFVLTHPHILKLITFVVVNSAIESIIVYCCRIVDIVKNTKIQETISDYDS